MELPSDPMMLFSTVNMYLRDRYASLDELCADLDVDRAELEEKLRAVGFEYSAEHNKFWSSIWVEPAPLLMLKPSGSALIR